jgi:hypothetical protein
MASDRMQALFGKIIFNENEATYCQKAYSIKPALSTTATCTLEQAVVFAKFTCI